MKLIRSTKSWNCVLAAAAMVLGTTVQELEEIIGHDGSEIINPELKPPGDRKGFHMQEIIDAANNLGYAVTVIDARPIQTATGRDKFEINFPNFKSAEDRFRHYLDNNIGILCGIAPSGYWHGVAWDGKNVYDPQGRVYSLSDIKIKVQLFWVFSRKSISK